MVTGLVLTGEIGRWYYDVTVQLLFAVDVLRQQHLKPKPVITVMRVTLSSG